MADIPREIDVGPFRYQVITQEEPICPEQAPTWAPDALLGQCDERYQRLWVTTKTTPDQRAETLLHELLHALHFLAGLNAFDKVRVEEFVDRISPLLLDALRRNPSLVAFLLEER